MTEYKLKKILFAWKEILITISLSYITLTCVDSLLLHYFKKNSLILHLNTYILLILYFFILKKAFYQSLIWKFKESKLSNILFLLTASLGLYTFISSIIELSGISLILSFIMFTLSIDSIIKKIKLFDAINHINNNKISIVADIEYYLNSNFYNNEINQKDIEKFIDENIEYISLVLCDSDGNRYDRNGFKIYIFLFFEESLKNDSNFDIENELINYLEKSNVNLLSGLSFSFVDLISKNSELRKIELKKSLEYYNIEKRFSIKEKGIDLNKVLNLTSSLILFGIVFSVISINSKHYYFSPINMNIQDLIGLTIQFIFKTTDNLIIFWMIITILSMKVFIPKYLTSEMNNEPNYLYYKSK